MRVEAGRTIVRYFGAPNDFAGGLESLRFKAAFVAILDADYTPEPVAVFDWIESISHTFTMAGRDPATQRPRIGAAKRIIPLADARYWVAGSPAGHGD